jgi:general secretion pathway protein D
VKVLEGKTVLKKTAIPVLLAALAVFLSAGPARAQDETMAGDGQGEEFIEEEGAEFVEEEYAEEEEADIEEEIVEGQPPPQAPRPRNLTPPQPVRPAVPVQPQRPQRPQRPAVSPGRPQVPARSPNAKVEVKSGEEPGDPVSFDFREAPLIDVIESIARLTGRNFDIDPNIGAATVTLITHNDISPDLAFEVLESILISRGFSMVEAVDGNLIKVINSPDAFDSDKLPLYTETGVKLKGFDNLSTHVVSIQHADANDLSEVLQILGSKSASVDVYVPTNSLIITDTSDGIRRMFTFLEQADVPGFSSIMEIFTLEYTRAEILAQQIQEVLTESGSEPKPQTPTRVIRRPTRPTSGNVPGSSNPQVIGTRNEDLRIVPDERLNALIVVTSEGVMQQVRDLVRRLDTPTPYESNNLHIYELLNADAEAVETALQPLVGAAPRQAAAKGAPAAAQGGEVQPFEQKIQVARYDQTNSLLIVASPQDYKLLEAFIARLDMPQRQVLVDAVVMDVTITDEFGVSVDAAKITGNDGFGMTSTSNISGISSAFNPAAAAANSIVAGPAASLGGSLMALGEDGGFTAGVFDNIEVEVGGYEMKIPFVPVLFQAIEQVTDIEVLSQPSLVTVDNEEASIVVGQEVPFITATSRPGTDSSGNVVTSAYSYGTTRVQREEVGVKLKMTPQISEGDNVLLQIEIEVSDTDAKQIGTVDVLGPTTNKSLIQNKVLVKDGSTAILAGLIRDTAKRDRKQAPFLGDIPAVGWLFRSKSHRREKRNMVVLVTPHIVKENIDMERVAQYKVGEYHDQNIEELLKGGFFKKIKRKSDMRKKHRPTFDRAQSITGRKTSPAFGRGDVKR